MADPDPVDSGASPAPRPKSRAVRVLLVVAAVALVGAAAWAVHYFVRGRYRVTTNDAFVSADLVTISPRVAGYVEQVFVTDNQDVRAGQPLARIDARDYSAQAAQSRAQVDIAAAAAENIRAGIAEQRAAVDQSRAQLAAAQDDARFAAAEVARYAPLAASGAEPREKLASLRNEATRAANQVVARRAALTSAERRVGSLNAQVRQAQAQGASARAELEAANVNVGSTLLRAPAAGRIGDSGVRAGQFVQAGTRLMSVVPLQTIYVTANFKETQVGRLRPGQPAEIEVDALSGLTLRGHVQSLAPATGAQFSLIRPENATGNFTKIVQRIPVRIAIDAGPDARRILVPGMSVEVTVDTISARDELSRIQAGEAARGAAAR